MKRDLVLNNQKRLICHKTQTNKQTNIDKNYYAGESSSSSLSVIGLRNEGELFTENLAKGTFWCVL